MTSIRSNSQFSILNFQLIILLLLLISCSSTTETKSGSLSGSVILNNDTGNSALDPIDFSGATVALYHPATLDTTIVRLNSQYPNIGVQINQQTEFDHRLQNPAKVTTTNADGSFSISKIPTGKYNLVIMKEGWGVRYLYDINITEGENTLNTKDYPFSILNFQLKNNSQFGKSAIELFPVASLSGYINNNFEFEVNHNYIITDNATFTGNVVLNPLTYIWVNPGKKISFVTSLSTEAITSGFCHISSAGSMYSLVQAQPSDINRFDGVHCFVDMLFENDALHSVITTNAMNGWTIQTSGINIQNMIFRDSRIGLQFFNINNITVSNSNFNKCDNLDSGGIALAGCNQSMISDNVFVSNTISVRQHTSADANISNCYFYNGSNKDVYNLYETTGSVTHCVFTESQTAIYTSGFSNTNISYCDIQAVLGIFNIEQMNQYESDFTANFNNFNCSQFCVKTKARYYTTELIYYNCENNYWNTVNVSEIDNLIWDRNDETENNPEYDRLRGVVDYTPFRTTPVQDTGITGKTIKQ